MCFHAHSVGCMGDNWQQGGPCMAAKIVRRTPMVSGQGPTAVCGGVRG